MEALQTCKAALDGGLIGQADYDAVKASWLRAQSLRAAFDAGLMEQRDYDRVKLEFLQSIGCALSGEGGSGAPAPARRSRAPAAPPPPAPEPAPTQAASRAQATRTAARTPAPALAAASSRAPSVRDTPPPSSHVSSATSTPRTGPRSPMAANKFSTGKVLPGKSMSGYSIETGAVDAFQSMRAKSAFPWLTWKVSREMVVVDQLGAGGYEDFLAALPQNECRYAVYDYSVTTSEGRKLDKMVFVLWTPDNSSIKNKMMYSSTKDFFKGQLDGISCSMQADDLSELSKDEMHSYVLQNMTRK